MTDFDLGTFLPYQLAVIASRVSREFAELYMREAGLSIPEWRVIAHLSQQGEVSVREIHRQVDMDKSKVSRAAARLEERGLVVKAEHASDKRLVSLTLTEAGLDVMNRIIPLARDYERALIARLPQAMRDDLRPLLAAMMDPPDDSV
ncbi:MAG: MarR family winged helix-turn-helix transcriptional regulator [Pseudomonadota bacterium]